MANLVLSSGETLEITTPNCLIGRENCPITIPDNSLSRNHAQIVQTPNGDFCISDLGSTNGTLLNGDVLNTKTHYKLVSGDELVLGDIKVLFQEENNSGEISTENTITNTQSQTEKQIIPTQKRSVINKQSSNTNFIYAGFWQRFIACFIDGIAISIGFGIIIGIFAAILLPLKQGGILSILGGLIFLLGVPLYYASSTSSTEGGTIGKKVMNIKVVNLDGNTISFMRAFVRYLGHYVSASFFCIGYLMQPFTERKQSLHDLIVGTVVIKTN